MIPAYDDLPRLEEAGIRHAWDVFGPEDVLGTLNHLTPERVLAALAGVRQGIRIGLDLGTHVIDPPLFGRRPMVHNIIESGPVVDERLDAFHPQGGTQWDGFGHYRIRGLGHYGGRATDSHEGRPSIHHWAEAGIVGRGVLLDVAAHRNEPGQALAEGTITVGELETVAAAQDIKLQPGDIVCVRTGWLRDYLTLDQGRRAAIAEDGKLLTTLGLAADESMARWLWNAGVAAVAADNPAVEQTPGSRQVGSLHRRLLAGLGMPLGELFDFERLAATCREHKQWTFAFMSAPLALYGGVGSTGNAMGIL